MKQQVNNGIFSLKQKIPPDIFATLILISIVAAVLLPNTGPLSTHTTWCMTNDYFNFTKSMMRGKVLYTDLYDHKGLFLFILYMIPVWISDTSLIGVFIMEALVSIGIVFSCYRFCNYRYGNVISLLLTALTVIILRLVFPQIYFNTEPICLIILFLLLRYVDDGSYKELRKRDYIWFGLAFAMIFWMKYPLVIMLFPFWLYFLLYALREKKTAEYVKCCGVSILTVIAFSIPMISYFVYHRNLSEMIYSYFFNVKMDWRFFDGTLLEYSVIAIFVIAIAGTILTFINQCNKQEISRRVQDTFFLVWFVILFIITNFSGGMRSYTSCFVVVFLSIYLPILIKYNIGRGISAFALSCLFLFSVPLLFSELNGHRSVEEIANEYGVTNDNILYLFEDMGFGTYSSEPFRHKYQWKPARVAYEDNEEIYHQTLLWLQEQEFEFLCISKTDYEYDVDLSVLGKDHCMGNLVLFAQKYYEVVETFDFHEGITEEYYLCRRKNTP